MTSYQTCYLCKKEKELSFFTQDINHKYYKMCQQCVSTILLKSGHRIKKSLLHTETHRTCYLCQRFLEKQFFTQRKNGTFFSACKDCNRHVFQQRRRARMLGAKGDYTLVEWELKCAKYDSCPMCQRKWDDIPLLEGRKSVITVDHIIPISKGGNNSIENLQPLCTHCNSAKGAKLI